MSEAIYPELIAGREDGAVPGPWRVEEGGTNRGEASCSVSERMIQVPLQSGERARVVRAHELMHARVSPLPEVMRLALQDHGSTALMMAEELRVNTLIGRLGFDTEQLFDGSEAVSGKDLASADNWGRTVLSLGAVMNTGGEKKYLAAVRKERPDWMPGLRAVITAIKRLLDSTSTEQMGSTTLRAEGIPEGFRVVTLRVTELLERAAGAAAPEGTDGARHLRQSLRPGARRPQSGRFAALVMEPFDRATAGAPRNSVRGARPTNSGGHVRHPERTLTDPQRRVFERRARRAGGIVLVDQSGSMDLDLGQLEDLVKRHPRVLIIGYSHRPGDVTGAPNAWVLANRGQIAGDVHAGNVGNGVDGPVLRWALHQREGSETVVWVCDGQVTDSNDHPSPELARECATLVIAHRVQMARHLDDVEAALMSRSAITTSWGQFGRVGKAVRELLHEPVVIPPAPRPALVPDVAIDVTHEL